MEPPSSVSFCPCLAADTMCRRSCEDAAAQHLQLYFLPREERDYTHTDTGYFCRVGAKPSKPTPRMLLGQSRHNTGKTRAGFDHGVWADPLSHIDALAWGLLGPPRAPDPLSGTHSDGNLRNLKFSGGVSNWCSPKGPWHPISSLPPGGLGQTSALHTQTLHQLPVIMCESRICPITTWEDKQIEQKTRETSGRVTLNPL